MNRPFARASLIYFCSFQQMYMQYQNLQLKVTLSCNLLFYNSVFDILRLTQIIALLPGFESPPPTYNQAQGYPPQQQGYPPQPQGYPAPQQGYPAQQGYPPQQGYPAPAGYNPVPQGYPPQQGYPQGVQPATVVSIVVSLPRPLYCLNDIHLNFRL